MPSVVGLGSLANQIVSGFEVYPEYDVYRIGTNVSNDKFNKKMKSYATAEEHEKNPPATKKFLSQAKEDVVFVCCGAEAESGAALRILETLKDRNITVIYLRKDLDLVSPVEKLQDKVGLNVLQQYARSGVFDRIDLIDICKVDEIIGDVSITEYAQKQAELVASTYHMVQVFQSSVAVMSNMMPAEIPNKISTLGLTEIGENEDKWLFELDKTFEKYYLYAVNKDLLESDKRLLNRIKAQIKDRAQEDTKVMFGVYPTDYEQNYVFCLANTKFIQGEERA
jgi:hypothetical protein